MEHSMAEQNSTERELSPSAAKELAALEAKVNSEIKALPEPDFAVEALNLTKVFERDNQRVVVMENLNFQVENKSQGEFVAIMGPSGSGKSTILKMIAGEHLPSSGEVRTFGKSVLRDNPDSVTVQQAYTTFPWLTVVQNVEFGLKIKGVAKKERRDLAMFNLERVGLADRANAFTYEMSGGMEQRVAIARCLATNPRIFLMDEPFGALDQTTRQEMHRTVLHLWQELTNCVVFITHQIEEALLLADRIIVLSKMPAKIVYDLEVPFPRPRVPELAFTPEFIEVHQRIASFLSEHQIKVAI